MIFYQRYGCHLAESLGCMFGNFHFCCPRNAYLHQMLPEGTPYTEEQIQELTRLHEELRQHLLKHKEYAGSLLTRLNEGDHLDEQEAKDLSLFARVSETLQGLEELLIGELSATIIGICEDAKMRAKAGDPEWVAKWQRMQPMYHTYMQIFTQRGLPKN